MLDQCQHGLEAIHFIELNAELAPPDPDGIRWRKTLRFPYLLYYFIVNANELHVYTIAHERRRPSYWKRRITLP